MTARGSIMSGRDFHDDISRFLCQKVEIVMMADPYLHCDRPRFYYKQLRLS